MTLYGHPRLGAAHIASYSLRPADMLRNICLYTSLLLTLSLKAQMLSQSDAIEMADRLHRVQILSDHGRQVLTDRIRENDLPRYQYGLNAGEEHTTGLEISRVELLSFLSRAFLTDLGYRSGMLEYTRLYGDYVQKRGQQTLSPEDKEKIRRQMADFEGYRIEAAIEPEPGYVPDDAGFSWYLTMSMEMLEPELISRTCSVTGKTKRRTLRDLRDLGLLTEDVHETINREMPSDQAAYEHTILAYAAQLMAAVESYPGDRAREDALIEALYTAGILSAVGYRRFTSRPEGSPLLPKIDLLRYSDRAIVVRPEELPADVEQGYSLLYDTLQSIVPNLSMQDLSVRRVVTNDAGFTGLVEYALEVAFTTEDGIYRDKFFYDFVQPEEAITDSVLEIHQDLTRSINRFLRDQRSDYRLYFAQSYPERNGYARPATPEFAFILLTEEEYTIWVKHQSHDFLSWEDHTNKFTSDRITSIIELYRDMGLFAHLSTTELQAGRECAAQATIASYQDILLCFPKTIVYFDWETGNLENPYEELTNQFAAASRGAFSPTDVQDNFAEQWEEDHVDFSFHHAGRHYQEKLRMELDWLDPSFLVLIERAMKENKVEGEFHYALDDGQAAGYLFLTPEQHSALLREQPDFFPEY
ncbi:hypothetical protein CLV84_0726 [Neolewinella xylanilytica]|uniref:Uncharacterized protein n=1 Tax=Neolewinella xylanilytica TaxID=1514080 RepID=A0A2S6I8F1_9BACT|nr:hypothetical protein [Neolewinella xylanilytica]PPK87774.1 hypothetical protein CLV84_0726 [Neolewinella xylanilytica]